MLELDREYREFLEGTSVRYEMYAKSIDTENKADINNYSSAQYFSESDQISVGFFGMATCEFEIEEKSLSEGEHVQIMAVTPDYKVPKEFEDGYYVGNNFGEDEEEIITLINKIKWYNKSGYSAVLFYATDITDEDAYYIYHIGVGGNYIYPTAIYLDIWNTANVKTNSYGILIQRTKIKKVDGVWEIGTYSTWNPGTSFKIVSSDALTAYFFTDLIYTGQGSEETQIIGHIENYPKEFPVFTGFVNKIEEKTGVYTVSCNDLSYIFDTATNGNDVGKLISLKKYADVLDYFMNDYVTTWRMKGNGNTADIYGNQNYDEIVGGYERFQLTRATFGATKREIIANICAQINANAYINNKGELILKSYPLSYNTILPTESIYENGLSITSSNHFYMNKINFINCPGGAESTTTYTKDLSSVMTPGNELNIYFKNFIKSEFPTGDGTLVVANYMTHIGSNGNGGSVEFVGNFVHEVGDGVSIQIDNEVYNLVISEIEHECDGGLITKINSYVKNDIESSTSSDANTSYSGSSASAQNTESIINLQQQINAVNNDISEFKDVAVQSVLLNGTELKSGTTATIPIASATQDGALSKELYEEINSEITADQIDEWFGTELDLGVNVFGNYSNKIQTETLLTTAIVGTEVTDA